MSAQIERAAALLRQGELVAFPTETVYGLGADASNPEAVAKIFAAKGRPADHPLIVHLPGIEHLERWAREIPDKAYALAKAFWPGPLTLILKRQPSVPDAVTGGQDTVGIRVPGHPLALELLKAFDGGIAAPSANRFGHVSPTTAQHVHDELGDSVAMVQMPGGIPVATFAIGEAGATNAALFAVSMLALSDADMAKKLSDFRRKQTEKVLAKTLPEV
jgi:L-threonylcarbamoyladenylate synthase